jgi:hypothetical protein
MSAITIENRNQSSLTMQTLIFDVTGMTCGGCTGSVQRALSKVST